jgi:polysaccharide biosynthesis protein PslH
MTRVLWFHPRPVTPPIGGGQVRTLGLIRAVRDAGHDVMLVQPAHHRDGAGLPEGVREIDLSPRTGAGRLLAKSVSRSPLRSPQVTRRSLRNARREIDRFGPELAVVSDVLAWSIAGPLLSDTPWIYDAHNVESDLYRRFLERAQSLSERLTFAVDARRMLRVETRAARMASAVVTVSDTDAQRMSELAPVRRSIVVPSSVPTPAERARPEDAPLAILFVGTLDYPPNVEAVTELITRTVPAVRREVPGVCLDVIGRRAGRVLRQLTDDHSWCTLHEEVIDLGPWYQSVRCVVLPIRSGGGSRLKVYEALAHGLPVIGTRLAVAGVPLPDALDALISDDPEALGRLTVDLMLDPDRAGALGREGARLFDAQLSWPTVSRSMVDLLETLAVGSPDVGRRPHVGGDS